MRIELSQSFVRIFLVVVALVVAGCSGAQPADPTGETGATTANTAPTTQATRPQGCDPPLVGHWKQTDQDAHDYFAEPENGMQSGEYTYFNNGTTQTGRYDVVHDDRHAGCEYKIVAFLVFLEAEPGVATWNFTSPTMANVENDRAWKDRPGNFTVAFVDNKQEP